MVSRDAVGLLGHWDALQACGCPSLGQPLGHRWPPWLLGHSAGTWSMCGQLLVSCWSTDGLRGRWGSQPARGQLLVNCWSAFGQPLAFVAAGTLCWLVVNAWPTVGQPLVYQDNIGLHSCLGALLVRGQLVANCWSTIGQLGQHWDTTGTPPAFVATGAHCDSWPTCGQPLVNQDTVGLLGHRRTLLMCGRPLVDHWPLWPPWHAAGLWNTSRSALG